MNPALMAMVKGAKAKYSRNTSRAKKLKEGKTKIRILQADPNAKFWADLGVHWIKTEKDGKPVAVVGCVSHVKDEPCEICTLIEKAAKAAPDDATLDIVKEWKVKKSVLVNALIRSGDEKSDDPVILELGTTVWGDILSMIEEYGENDPLDPKKGIDFVIERKGKGKDTKYTVMPAAQSTPVPDSALQNLHDLEAFIETEFFRGEEKKAINAINGMFGFSSGPALAGPKSGNALLTSRASQVEDAVVEDDLATIAEIEVDEFATAAPPSGSKPAAAKPSAAKTAPQAAVVEEPAAGDDFGAAIPAEDVDSLLSELDGI